MNKKFLKIIFFILFFLTTIKFFSLCDIVHTYDRDFSSGVYVGGGVEVLNDQVNLAYRSAEVINFISSRSFTLQALPKKIYIFSCSIWNSKIYVAGGVEALRIDGEAPPLLRFSNIPVATPRSRKVFVGQINEDFSISSWTELNDLPLELGEHDMVIYNGNIYICGGSSSGGSYIGYSSSVIMARIISDKSISNWIFVSTLPYSLINHKISCWDGRLYISGGQIAGSISTNTILVSQIKPDGTLTEWVRISSLPTVRYGHSVTIYNGYIYISGGYINNIVTNSVICANINSDGTLGSWVQLNSLPTPIVYHSMVVYNDKLFIVGGSNNGSNSINNIYMANINPDGRIGDWVSLDSIPYIIKYHSSVAYKDKIYLLGGYVNEYPTDQVFMLELNRDGEINSWQEQTFSLTSRRNHASVIYNNRIYVSGGQIGQNLTSTNSVIMASINDYGSLNNWVHLTPLPQARSHHTMVVVNERLYVIGGLIGGSASNSVLYANINPDGTIGSWNNATTLQVGFFLHDSSVWRGQIYVVGGLPSSISVIRGIVSGLNPGEITWSNVSSLPEPKSQHKVCIYNNNIYVLGGMKSYFPIIVSSSVIKGEIQPDGSISSWTYQNYLPIPVKNHTVGVWNSRLFVLGGETYSDEDIKISSIYVTNISSTGNLGNWSKISTDLPQPIINHDSELAKGRIYILGGETSSGLNSKVYYSNNLLYCSTGSYFSYLVDLGSPDDVTVSWSSLIPTGTDFEIFVSTASHNTTSLTKFSKINNNQILPYVRYINYKLYFKSDNLRQQTPILYEIRFLKSQQDYGDFFLLFE